MDDKVTIEEAKENLEKLRGIMKSTVKVKPNVNIRNPSDLKDVKVIHYFPKCVKEVRENFKKHLDTYLSDLRKKGPTGYGPKLGQEWHKILHEYLTKQNPNDSDRRIGRSVIEAVKENLPGIEFLQSEFPLHGYMTNKTLDVSFWSGKADAIGWYDNNYVIVDWKAVDILTFWNERLNDVLRQYFHQCLVYAKLLMVQLGRQKLPYILIVPISNFTGSQIHPGLFCDFPHECKKKLDEYDWSKAINDFPNTLEKKSDQCKSLKITVKKKPKTLALPKNLAASKLNGFIEEDMMVKDVFKSNCTVKQMLEAFGFDKLLVN
ncbi:uncharacterized protein LOC114522139 [Dendronephthya gigantea]|uniref:uncharacterized protein LOC114522139 n=1 Tax=Dendronephthya gigantea TaxID=151771 RepID=UPI00106A5146|nr:uncharacterized protein LOC114522139 [Dendronephthya gigantea]